MSLFDGMAAQCDNFTSGKTATSCYLTVSGVAVNLNTRLLDGFPLLSVLFFSFTRSDRESQKQHGCSYRLHFTSYLPSVQLTACRMTRGRRLPQLKNRHPSAPPPILKRPQEIMRFDAVISRLLRAVFQ